MSTATVTPTAAQTVGQKLVDLVRQGRNLDAIATLYSPDVVSVEAFEMAGFPRVQHGIEAIRGKNQWWLSNHELHSQKVEGPMLHGDDRFAVIFDIDVTPKAGPMVGKRIQMREIGIYTVQNHKIIREEFYYGMM